MASSVSVSVDLRVSVAGKGVKLWRIRVLCWCASLLGVPLTVAENAEEAEG